ncbi:unnamed protein product, partial [Coregonus sp. 'balchen']
GVSSKALQACTDQLALPFQKLFQLSLNSGIIPDLWKKSLIDPMHKNNRPKENNDLRPVALSCTYEMGVEDALLVMLNNIYEHIEKANSPVKIIFIDFSSLFNTIQPHLLVDKLVNLGVKTLQIKWINSF